MRVRVLSLSALAVLVLLSAVGCSGSVSIGDKTVSASELEKEVSPIVAKQVGGKPDKISCKSLEAKVGANSTCQVTVNGENLLLKVTATKVEGTDVKFSIAVQDAGGSTTTTEPKRPSTPEGSGSATAIIPKELQRQVTAGIKAQVGQDPPPVTCDAPLEGVVGATGFCYLMDGTKRYEIALTVTSVEGRQVLFDFEVADQPS